MEKSHLDTELLQQQQQQSNIHRHSGVGTGEDSSDPQNIRSYGSHSHHRRSNVSCSEIIGVSDSTSDNNNNKRRDSLSLCGSECCVEIVDLESGIHIHDNKSHADSTDGDDDEEEERDCRICHLSLDLTNQENGVPIELGCCCKDDLAAAHKHCAEAWFKIKGNKTCEICGSVARNVVGASEAELVEQWNEANDATTTARAAAAVSPNTSETRNFWQGHRFLNFLLACMVFAFVISWLFHFNVPS